MKQSIILHPHEARRLQAAGSVLAVRPVEPQPFFADGGKATYLVWAPTKAKPRSLFATINQVAPAVMKYCPYPLGARLAVREAFRYIGYGSGSLGNRITVRYEADNAEVNFADTGQVKLGGIYREKSLVEEIREGRLRSASTMPLWASRASVEVVAVECQRVCEIKESDATMCGFASDVYPPDDDGNRCFKRAREVFVSDWEQRFGARYPWASAWAWFYFLEKRP